MDRVMRKSAFEHAQNEQIQIILHVRKVPSAALLSIHSVYNNSVSGVKALIRLRGRAG